uniref:Carbonic anhydrase n=1 Tax=Nasutitermes takasagoensis TaxID=62960 RepID=A0A140KFJ8_9NEOP|nr:carbonic anhydrase [Nasutitermes takasagoensis]
MSAAEWGYTKRNGPFTWAKNYPTAAGIRQSPVDIDTALATSDSSLESKPLRWKYVPQNTRTIVNSGHGWRVDVDSEGSELVGGPLEGTYKLQQFHCHWGSSSDKGSEHTVDGQSYAAELHLVHWNSSKYADCGEAADYPDGLTVLGVLLKVGAKNPELQKVIDLIPSISHRGEKTEVKEAIDPAKMLPKTLSYWTYLGSLTVPPCNESVTWILFKEPVEVSEEQLAAFRSLRCYKRGEECPCDEVDGLLISNYRPTLPLGTRELRECGSV